jgi:hypothetical protein
MNFTSTHKWQEVDIENLSKKLGVEDADFDTSSVSATVKFYTEMEARDYGIKSISVIVTEVSFSLNWQMDLEYLSPEEQQKLIDAGGQKTHGGLIEGSISTTTDDSWDIVSELKVKEDGALSVDNVTIDLTGRTITVQ